MKKYKDKRAFTLIELVVVLVILSILVGIALPTYMGMRARAYRAEALQMISEVKVMAWGYRLERGTATDSGWNALQGLTSDQRFGLIGYSAGQIPRTDNFRFVTAIHATGDAAGVTYPLDCDAAHGRCFVIIGTPRVGGSADLAGSDEVYMVMNYTSGVEFSYVSQP